MKKTSKILEKVLFLNNKYAESFGDKGHIKSVGIGIIYFSLFFLCVLCASAVLIIQMQTETISVTNASN